MSFFSGGKAKEKDPFSSKSQFYVEFLGWMECRGVRGQIYTDPVVRELRARQKHMEKPPKLTIQVSRKDIKITQEVEDPKKRSIKKIKFPTIPARDVTYVRQARHSDGRLDDIVACIYLGFMPRTQRYVHVHVYRFDEATTATLFTKQLNAIVDVNYDHILEVEMELIRKGEVDDLRVDSGDIPADQHTTDSALGSASSAYSDDEPPDLNNDDVDFDLQSLKDVKPFDSVADELKYRLQIEDKPLLLPPRDYDTISRAHGNLEQINKRRCMNLNIVGPMAMGEVKERNGSSESGVDLISPGSETNESLEKAFPSSKANPRAQEKGVSPVTAPQLQEKGFKEYKPSSQAAGKSDSSSSYTRGSQHSGSTSPGTPPTSAKDFVYPPKVKSPPHSPKLYRSQHSREQLVKQNSLNTYLSDVSRLGQLTDHGLRPEKPLHYYPGEDSEDIYTHPIKKSNRPSRNLLPADEIPPDYNDDLDDDVIVQGRDIRYRQDVLTRSMPADLIRDEMALGNSSRPSSGGDVRNMRRTDSPTVVGGNNFGYPGNNGVYAPKMGRANSTKK